MFDRYTRDPKTRIWFVTIIVMVVYAYQVYRLGWPTIMDVLIYISLTMFGPLFPEFKDVVPIPENMRAITGDVVLFFIIFFFALIFFAQFVLPLNHTRERIQAAQRLFLYLFGSHGPAIFIQDGKVVRGEKELEKLGEGVILLDTASAVTLRTALTFTRAVGPGTVFIHRKEKVAGKVDLHRQAQFFGPNGGEDPFTPKGEEEPQADYDARQARRWATSGLTRDGVEVVPNITALFKLIPLPKEEVDPNKIPSFFEQLREKYSARQNVETRFGFNPDSVAKAIQHEGIDPEESTGSDKRHIPWNKLPVFLAVEVWREYIRKYTFDELFNFTSLNPGDRDRKTAFELIGAAVMARMTRPVVDQYDEFGRPTGKQMESPEYKLLQDRGIQVIASLVLNPRFKGEVDDKLFEQWRANWLDRAKENARFVKQERSYAEHKGAEMAAVNFADSASRLLGYQLVNQAASAPDLSNSLELLVRGTLEQCIRDPELHQHLTNEKLDIASLIEWIRSN